MIEEEGSAEEELAGKLNVPADYETLEQAYTQESIVEAMMDAFARQTRAALIVMFASLLVLSCAIYVVILPDALNIVKHLAVSLILVAIFVFTSAIEQLVALTQGVNKARSLHDLLKEGIAGDNVVRNRVVHG